MRGGAGGGPIHLHALQTEVHGGKLMVQVIQAWTLEYVMPLQHLSESFMELTFNIVQEVGGELRLALRLVAQPGSDSFGIVDQLIYLLYYQMTVHVSKKEGS